MALPTLIFDPPQISPVDEKITYGHKEAMKQTTVSGLKARLSGYLAEVRSGETVIVCDRKTPTFTSTSRKCRCRAAKIFRSSGCGARSMSSRSCGPAATSDDRVPWLLRKRVARTAELLREVLELRQAVMNGEHLLSIVHMQARLKYKLVNGACRHIGHRNGRVQH
jgi:hypothetical protein